MYIQVVHVQPGFCAEIRQAQHLMLIVGDEYKNCLFAHRIILIRGLSNSKHTLRVSNSVKLLLIAAIHLELGFSSTAFSIYFLLLLPETILCIVIFSNKILALVGVDVHASYAMTGEKGVGLEAHEPSRLPLATLVQQDSRSENHMISAANSLPVKKSVLSPNMGCLNCFRVFMT
jgi:hypothetical protein